MDTTPIDLNLLATLEALLVEQNVTRAASRLRLSQPAVSAQLARLRKLFGDALLIPARRGMVPTARALELLEPLRQSLDLLRTTLSSKRPFDPATAALTVRIACTDYLQSTLVMPLMLELRRRAPEAKIAVHNLDLATLEDQMARGAIDLALMTPREAAPRLRSRHLFDERYVVIGRKRHPGLHSELSIEAWVRLEHVIVSLRGGGFSSPVDRALAAMGHRRKVVHSAASFLYVPELVARSNLVALVPERLVRNRHAELKVVDSPLPLEFAVGMVWHERSHGHPGHRWLRETVAEVARS